MAQKLTPRAIEALDDRSLRAAAQDPAGRADLEAYFGDAAVAGLRASTREAAPFDADAARTVLLLPGVLGSSLEDRAALSPDLVWIDLPQLAVGSGIGKLELDPSGERDAAPGVRMMPLRPLRAFYDLAVWHMQIAGLRVERFAYDWRRGIDAAAVRLSQRIEELSAGHDDSFDVVAHSAGGLVVRRYAQLEPERARRRVHQAVFLGTPFRGTFAPAQLFSGQHDIVRRFGVVLPGVAERLVQASWTFVGMAELLPDPDLFDCAFLYRAATWPLRSLEAARLEHALRFGDALRAPTPWLMERTSVIRADDRETTGRATFDGGVLSFFAGEVGGDGTIPSQSSWDDEARAHYRCRAEHSTLPLDGDVRAAVVALLQSDGERAADLPKQTAPARPRPTRALAAGPEGTHHDEAGAKQRVEQGEPRAADVVWLLGGDPKPLR